MFAAIADGGARVKNLELAVLFPMRIDPPCIFAGVLDAALTTRTAGDPEKLAVAVPLEIPELVAFTVPPEVI